MARQLTARLAQSTPRLLRRPLRPLKAAAEAGAKAEPHGQSQSEARTGSLTPARMASPRLGSARSVRTTGGDYPMCPTAQCPTQSSVGLFFQRLLYWLELHAHARNARLERLHQKLHSADCCAGTTSRELLRRLTCAGAMSCELLRRHMPLHLDRVGRAQSYLTLKGAALRSAQREHEVDLIVAEPHHAMRILGRARRRDPSLLQKGYELQHGLPPLR